MRQRHLDEFFSVPPRQVSIPSPGRNVFDLPFSARRLIYEYAGITGHLVDLNFANLNVQSKDEDLLIDFYYHFHRRETDIPFRKRLDVHEYDEEVWEFDEHDEDIDSCWGASCESCWMEPVFSLLLTSKAINKEVEALIYSENRFRVCQGNPQGFKWLWRMSDTAFAALGTLTIRLDAPQQELSTMGWDGSPALPTPIDLQSGYGRAALREWMSLVDRLARLVGQQSLQLYLVFRAVDMKVVKAILEPLDKLPVLKDCGIWAQLDKAKGRKKIHNDYPSSFSYIKPRPDNEVSDYVRQTIRKLTGISAHASSGFRYLELPQELRLLILQYTDLVSESDVQWRPHEQRPPTPLHHLPEYCRCYEDFGSRIMDEIGQCICSHRGIVDLRPDLNIPLPCCWNCKPEDESGLCFCLPSDMLSSSSCRCRTFRHPLFSVSSQTREDAIATYYSQNRFLVTPYQSPTFHEIAWNPYCNWPPPWFPDIPKIELSLYVTSLARTALQYIRWLEWTLPGFDHHHLAKESPAYNDYLDTLLLMQHAMNVQNLTFVINMAGCRGDANSYFNPPYGMHPKTWNCYRRIVFPVRKLAEAGLKDFFVYLHPADRTPPWREPSLERAVMGSQYDSCKRGKPRERFAELYEKSLRRYNDGFE